MLSASGHHGRDGSTSFLDAEAGVAIGCAHTATFLPQEAVARLPWQEDAEILAAMAGTIWPSRESAPTDQGGLAWATESFRRQGESFAGELDGNFSLVLWDKRQRRLHLVGDPLANKLLYYYFDAPQNQLIFASELKSVLAHPAVGRDLDTRSLSLYLGVGFVPPPFSMISDVRKVMPGEALVFSGLGKASRRYWKPELRQLPADPDALIEAVEEALAASVRRLTNGVPEFAVFLSGGVDSSVVLAAAKRSPELRPHAFTLLYDEEGDSEDLTWSERVATNLGVPWTPVRVDSQREIAPDLVSNLLAEIGEPFESASRSVSEHFLVSAAVRAGINSGLTGGGANVVFGRGRWHRYLAGGGQTEDPAALQASFVGYQDYFDLNRQRQALPWTIDDSVFREAAMSNFELLADLTPQLAVSLGRSLSGPQSHVGLFGAAIPPLYGFEERSAFFERRLVEFSMAAPPVPGDDRHGSKPLVKGSFQAPLGVDFNQRHKTAYPSAPLPSWLRDSMLPSLNGLVAEGLLQGRYVSKLAQRYEQGSKRARKEVWLFCFALLVPIPDQAERSIRGPSTSRILALSNSGF